LSTLTVHGLLLSVTNDMSYLSVDFIAGRKLKLSIRRQRMQFFRLCMLNWVAQAQKRLYCTGLAHFVCQFYCTLWNLSLCLNQF